MLQGGIQERRTGLGISDTVGTVEFNQSEYAHWHRVVLAVSAPSSLVGGILKLEAYDDVSSGWIGMQQYITVLASGGGTPAVVTGNTASATAIVGGVAFNTTGVTALSNTATVVITAPGVGARVRLSYIATSGTASLAFTYNGARAYVG